MGYYVTVQSHSIMPPEETTKADTLKAIISILDTDDIIKDYWMIEDDEIVPVEYDYKLSDRFFGSLKHFAKVGCIGYLEVLGEDNEWEKYELEDGKVFVYHGEIVYPEKASSVL